MLIGRNPQSQHAKIPSELKNIRCESFKIPNSDNYVSNVQGYFFADQYGNILYKDTSSNGLKMETYLTAKDEKMDEKVKTLFVGQSVVIDEKTPLLLSFGSANKTFFDTNILFSKENKNHLQNGGVFVIGRNPWSKSVQYPSELKNKYIKEMMLKNADDSVSRIQGYFFKNQKGQICYRDVSTNGTFIRPNNAFESRKMQNVVGGRN